MKVKVLFIGSYRDGTGWGHAAQDYILALDTAGIDVVPRATKFNMERPSIPSRIVELEQKTDKNPDVVIQNVLPHCMDYNGKIAKNIGLYCTETSNFNTSSWAYYLNAMDELWAFNDQMIESARNSYVTKPIKVVPAPCNMRKFQVKYEDLPFKAEYPENTFFFYTIGETNRRKNLPALLKAFHGEFDPAEPVELVIKTTSAGIQGVETIQNACEEVKQGMKMYLKTHSYKKEIIICKSLSENDVMRLHSSCDCFVSPSYGEAHCLPAFDAMGMGKTPIVTDCTGFRAYVSQDTGWPVEATEEPGFGAPWAHFWNLYTSRENWWNINILALRRAMREAYENKNLYQKKSTQGIEKVYEFSYEKIGQLMKSYLEA